MEQKRPLRLELEIIINWFLLDCVASKKKTFCCGFPYSCVQL